MRTTSVKSAARVLDLLELMAVLPSGLRLTEAARRLGLPKSSTSALFATLVGRGYVEAGADGYRLAPQFRDGSWIGGDYARLVKVAKPAMTRLASATGETAFIGIMTSDWGIQYVAKVVSAQPLRYDVDLGTMRPAYCTSIGLIMLASRPEEAVAEYLGTHPIEKVTPHTITDPQTIRSAIEHVRRTGYASLADSNVLGTSGVAAPVRGASGQVIAGLAVIAPSSRFFRQEDDESQGTAIRAVIDAAAEISDLLATYSESGPTVAREQKSIADAH